MDKSVSTPPKKAKKAINWKKCLVEAQYGFYTGALTGGAIALGGGLIMAITPRVAGRRRDFLLFEVPKLVLQGGLGFGGLLYVGGFLRCL
jgi:hypothetical protein